MTPPASVSASGKVKAVKAISTDVIERSSSAPDTPSPKARWDSLRAKVFASETSFRDQLWQSDVPGLLDALHSRVFSTSTQEECQAWIEALSQDIDTAC